MKLRVVVLPLLIVLMTAGSAFAINFGLNITIPDRNPTAGLVEDNEVEPNCLTGQQWDLEAFFLAGTDLTIVGGYNFKTGEGGWMAGDIFIDVDGDAKWGPDAGGGSGNNEVLNTFGYDYVLAMDYIAETYSVYAIDGQAVLGVTTENVYYQQNEESNPWTYVEGGQAVGGYQDLTMAYFDAIADVDGVTLWNGQGTHYAATVDLTFLGDEINGALIHSTYQCGNDNLMAQIPDATSLVLLGSAMILGALFSRRKRSEQEQA